MKSKSKLFDHLPVLEDERIRIRPVSYKNAEALQRMKADPAVYRFLPTFLFE